MKPYYDHNGITIYHGDCLEILPQLEPVDLILTDPPYGLGMEYGDYDDTEDNLVKLISEGFPHIKKISKTILITPGVINQWFYPRPDWVLSWYVPGASATGKWGFSCWQPILAYGKDPYLKNGKGRRPDIIVATRDNLMGNADMSKKHPCPKPLGLWKKILIRGSCLSKDIILDPFMGSGTTVVSAKQLGYRAIGIEINEKYCEIAARRLSQEMLPFGSNQKIQGT